MSIIHIGCEPNFEAFVPVSEASDDFMYQDRGYDKPEGGLWASEGCDEYGADWLRYLKDNDFKHSSIEQDAGAGFAYRITPTQGASICTITCEEDYDILRYEFFPHIAGLDHWTGEPRHMIDWKALAEVYDIVHVKDWRSIESWDCETYVFLTWDAIGRVERCDTTETYVDATVQYIDEREAERNAYVYEDDDEDSFDPFETLKLMGKAFEAREAGDESEFERLFDVVEERMVA